MTLAVKGLLVERGLDPRRFTLLCYGGCGPLFGAPIARALAIGRIVVPGLSAVFSAYGAATADVRREAVRTLFRPLPVELDALAAAFAALEAEVRQAMRTEGVDAAHVTLVPEVDLRFHRQTWEVTVPLAPLDRPTVEGLGDAFRARYAELYGRGAPGEKPLFHVVEFWIENRLMLELAPEEMMDGYLDLMQLPVLDRFFGCEEAA